MHGSIREQQCKKLFKSVTYIVSCLTATYYYTLYTYLDRLIVVCSLIYTIKKKIVGDKNVSTKTGYHNKTVTARARCALNCTLKKKKKKKILCEYYTRLEET